MLFSQKPPATIELHGPTFSRPNTPQAPATPGPTRVVQAIVSSHATNPPPRRLDSAADPVTLAEARRSFKRGWDSLVTHDKGPQEEDAKGG